MTVAQRSLSDLIKKALTPLLAVQVLTMTVCGVVMLFDGSIMYVMPFFILLILSPIVYSILLAPAGIFANIMQATSRIFPRFSSVMMGVTLCYILAALTATAAVTFAWIVPAMHGKMFVIGLIFGVVAAPAPWAVFALKDRDTVLFTALVLFMQAGMVVMAIVGVVLMRWPVGLLMYKNAALLYCVMGVLVYFYNKHEGRFLQAAPAPPPAPTSVVAAETPHEASPLAQEDAAKTSE